MIAKVNKLQWHLKLMVDATTCFEGLAAAAAA